MQDYISFEGRVTTIQWGEANFTILRVPDAVMERLGHPKRVEGEINDHPVNLAPQTAPVVEGPFLWTGKTLLHEIGVVPGDLLQVRLRPADPNDVEVPRDILSALRSAGVLEPWEALTPGKRRGILSQITRAKREETRTNRIKALIAELERPA